MSIKYEVLPQSLQQEARLYIEKGTQPGELMTAVIQNDLSAAFKAERELKAIDKRFEDIDAVAEVEWFFSTEAPEDCSGGAAAMAAWMGKSLPKEDAPVARLKAECGDFKADRARTPIRLWLDGDELTVFTVPRRHAAIVVRLINDRNQQTT